MEKCCSPLEEGLNPSNKQRAGGASDHLVCHAQTRCEIFKEVCQALLADGTHTKIQKMETDICCVIVK